MLNSTLDHQFVDVGSMFWYDYMKTNQCEILSMPAIKVVYEHFEGRFGKSVSFTLKKTSYHFTTTPSP